MRTREKAFHCERFYSFRSFSFSISIIIYQVFYICLSSLSRLLSCKCSLSSFSYHVDILALKMSTETADAHSINRQEQLRLEVFFILFCSFCRLKQYYH